MSKVREILKMALEAGAETHGFLDRADLYEEAIREALAALHAKGAGLPLDPTPEMVEAGAARLMSYEAGSTWPDSFTPIQQRAARNDAEKVWRSMVLAIPLPGQSQEPAPDAGLREALAKVEGWEREIADRKFYSPSSRVNEAVIQTLKSCAAHMRAALRAEEQSDG